MIPELYDFVRKQVYSCVSMNDSHIAERIRSAFYDTDTKIKTGVLIKDPNNYDGDPRSTLYHGVEILNQNGNVRLGENSHLGAYCLINAVQGSVNIGNDVAIGPGCRLIAYSNSYKQGQLVTDTKEVGDITIGNNVFIGANSTILPGARIEDNTIIGAQSLVSGELKGDSVYAGTPCKKISDNWYE